MKISEIWTRGLKQFQPKWVFFVAYETSQEKGYCTNYMMTCLEQRNPRIEIFDTKFYETSSQMIEKIDQHLIIQPL